MENVEELKQIINTSINNDQEHVSSIYLKYIRPYFASHGDLNEFLSEPQILEQFPPSIIKIRRYLFQILLLLDIYRSRQLEDPITEDNLNQLLFLIRSIAPLAAVISSNILTGIFEELQLVHNDYPQTLFFLKKGIGMTENFNQTDELDDEAQTIPRIHYEDGETVLSGLEFQPNKTMLQHFPLFINDTMNQSIIAKKPKHGPQSIFQKEK